MSLEEEITEHERRLKERDSYNREVWLALMEGRTPPEKPKPRFRPESFFEPRKFKRKPKKSRIALPARELSNEVPKDVTKLEEFMLHFPDEHDKATPEDAADMQDAQEEHEQEEETEPCNDQRMIANS